MMATEHPLGETLAPSRRSFILGGTALLAGSLAQPAWAQSEQAYASDFWRRPRRVHLRHSSGEEISSVYWSDGQLVMDEYVRLSWFMRDRVVNKAVYMNPVVLDITYAVCGWLTYFGLHKPPVLTSGHRDRVRNSHIEGAAKDSKHITGDALDLVIPEVSSLQVARFGAWLGAGGVGWYPSKGFTHLDRGRLRTWQG